MRKWIVPMLVAVLLCVLCTACFAGEIGDTIDWAWTSAWKLLGITIAGFAVSALKRLGKKYGIEISEKEAEDIERKAIGAIGYAEEWARERANVDATVRDSDAKFEKAVLKLCANKPWLDEAEVRDIIVTNLPKFRAMIDSEVKKRTTRK